MRCSLQLARPPARSLARVCFDSHSLRRATIHSIGAPAAPLSHMASSCTCLCSPWKRSSSLLLLSSEQTTLCNQSVFARSSRCICVYLCVPLCFVRALIGAIKFRSLYCAFLFVCAFTFASSQLTSSSRLEFALVLCEPPAPMPSLTLSLRLHSDQTTTQTAHTNLIAPICLRGAHARKRRAIQCKVNRTRDKSERSA